MRYHRDGKRNAEGWSFTLNTSDWTTLRQVVQLYNWTSAKYRKLK